MHSWTSPDIPLLPGQAPTPRLFNQASGEIEPAPGTGGTAGLYVCGITPYDATHLGHASTYLAFDTLNRLWRDAGLTVDYAQNVTDVDDPLLERATATGVNWRELAASQTDLFRGDMEALRVIAPTSYVAVTEVVDEIGAAAAQLVEAGFAYTVPTPDALQRGAEDVYFDAAHAESATSWFLGMESRYDHATMLELFAQRGGDPDRAGKRDALDPLLWRVAREGEPEWPSAVGSGRPGWHIECAVIALKCVGENFAVQGGGADLIFPHHEFSAAHATALTGQPFASIHAHTGMVAYQGEKMSKSLGNLVLVSRLRAAGVDVRVIRLALLAHHYRSDWEYTDADLALASDRLARWSAAAQDAGTAVPADAEAGTAAGTVAGTGAVAGAAALTLLGSLRAALAADLDTPAALALLDGWFAAADAVPALVVDAVDALLGIRLTD
ncbi:cysteine--1-D-myo-inosityl 2-amino-2-deoxy-alpha-D-glucopyranoside ligase [Subtercola boreus]|uniref:L-cysteine:1D-myo-inositol 2-amino-2-deoxy-alpha-D-glucopyranoside ligase n=1 Tax=Subtercola boreus TaxID=120213 RepID=A0A3E0WCY0_9MICO|nr:cysteine--1-D-myo-inosityl 2-amino-2-deoxy-alpha-D-glucopyranoside ligase [Subtercola boreus]RFA21216.1 cysteine--1-D-myo-inosityl 2-amino-2-deoxy-alpha-D-glucopyranoside ligase [Subtercola boreus]RFA21599.1 cysteine--1-D-myo-inosityl 2-amino-2-deoxy-alpha-D-glucopyranoside ligase [Subtercola boreus]RFA27568.1 cysteine--1-D-myo-inosityl 2-amino-2-deoxy-alpha-D-glucopyranoside ligase [Subtercola boreus]